MAPSNPTSSVMYQVYGSKFWTPRRPTDGFPRCLTSRWVGHSRPTTAIARVRIIVPSTEGTHAATMSVYPCLYDITYERGR